jgi:hypothetical protein
MQPKHWRRENLIVVISQKLQPKIGVLERKEPCLEFED